MKTVDYLLEKAATSRGFSLLRGRELQSRLEFAVEEAVNRDKRSSYYHAMKACVKRSPEIRTVVDIGASNGMWSRACMEFYPDARYLMIEAQQVHEADLTKFCEENKNCQFALAAAGGHEGEIAFLITDPLGGVASTVAYDENNVKVPMLTVDAELQSRNLEGPYLLKFDTHGFETQILEGCKRMLEQTEVIVMECYNHPLSEGCLLFFEMCQHLRERGFRPVDLFDVMYRPCDDSLWQMEIVFARESHPLFKETQYR
jgi:FkbM family methyltransferase